MTNLTFKDSFEALNDMLGEKGLDTVSENFARNDFGIHGGETNAQIQEWVNDYASELHTELCAAKNEWRYSQ